MTDNDQAPVQTGETDTDHVQEDWPDGYVDASTYFTAAELAEMEAKAKDQERFTKEIEAKIALALDQACRIDQVAERLRKCELDLTPCTRTLEVNSTIRAHGQTFPNPSRTLRFFPTRPTETRHHVTVSQDRKVARIFPYEPASCRGPVCVARL